jgi:hypothetical protein
LQWLEEKLGDSGVAGVDLELFTSVVKESMGKTLQAVRECDEGIWLVDSGGTGHVLGSCSKWGTPAGRKACVKLADESTVSAQRVSVGELKGETGESFNFGHMVQSESIKKNVLSVSRLISDGWRVAEDFSAMKSPGGTWVPIYLLDGLYYVRLSKDPDPSEKYSIFLTDTELERRKSEHERQGHIGKAKGWVCMPCEKAKGGRKSLKRKKKAKNLSDVKRFNSQVSIDTKGPLPKSLAGDKYWFVIVCSHSKWIEVYPQPRKTQAAAQKSLEQWERECGETEGKVERVRSDNGAEFMGEFGKGKARRYTNTYTAGQNGEAEAGNRVVATGVKVLLEACGLGEEYWALAARCFCHCLNRAPRRCLEWKSSYEVRFQRAPDLRHLRTFGSKCLYKPNKPKHLSNESKFSCPFREGTFVGYDAGCPGYLVQDAITHKVVSSNSTKFPVGGNFETAEIREDAVVEDSEGESSEIDEERVQVARVKSGKSGEGWGKFQCVADFLKMMLLLWVTLSAVLAEACTPREEAVGSSLRSDSSTLAELQAAYVQRRPRRLGRIEWKKFKRRWRKIKKGAKNTFEEDLRVYLAAVETDEMYASASRMFGARTRESIWVDKFQDFERELADQKLMDQAEQEVELCVTRVKMAEGLREDPAGWGAAIREEFEAITSKGVYTVVDRSELQKGDKPIPISVLLELKDSGRKKARAVCLGNRVSGCEVEDVYAPVASQSTLRLMLQRQVSAGYESVIFDISTAFLNAPLKERVVVRPPACFRDLLREAGHEGEVFWVLNRALYGLRQAPKAWNDELTTQLKELGWRRSEYDPCLFYRGDMMLLTYVDDCMLVGPGEEIRKAQEAIMRLFPGRTTKKESVIGCGSAVSYRFLGLEIVEDETEGNRKIRVQQAHLVDKVVGKFQMRDSPTAKTPIVKSLEEAGVQLGEGNNYRSIVGSLMFLSVSTRPDISYAVKELSRFLEKPTEVHLAAAHRVVRYLKGTRELGLEFNAIEGYKTEEALQYLEAQSDSDFAGEVKGRKSTTGNLVMINGTPIFWKSQTQRLVSLSTAEAEYISLASLVREVKYLRKLWSEMSGVSIELGKGLDVGILSKVNVRCDNEAALKMSEMDILTQRTKYIDVRTSFIRESVAKGDIRLSYIPTSENKADVFTKPLAAEKVQVVVQ